MAVGGRRSSTVHLAKVDFACDSVCATAVNLPAHSLEVVSKSFVSATSPWQTLFLRGPGFRFPPFVLKEPFGSDPLSRIEAKSSQKQDKRSRSHRTVCHLQY